MANASSINIELLLDTWKKNTINEASIPKFYWNFSIAHTSTAKLIWVHKNSRKIPIRSSKIKEKTSCFDTKSCESLLRCYATRVKKNEQPLKLQESWRLLFLSLAKYREECCTSKQTHKHSHIAFNIICLLSLRIWNNSIEISMTQRKRT